MVPITNVASLINTIRLDLNVKFRLENNPGSKERATPRCSHGSLANHWTSVLMDTSSNLIGVIWLLHANSTDRSHRRGVPSRQARYKAGNEFRRGNAGAGGVLDRLLYSGADSA